jgi:hypothetical protein
MAIVVAVAGVAGAATITIPEVADSVDHLHEAGVGGGAQISAAVVASMWLCFACATAVVAFAAWPVASRKNLRHVAALIYAACGVIVVSVLAWSAWPAWIVIAAASVFVIVTGVRNFDWTPLGRGIGIFIAGTAIVAVLAALEAWRELADFDGVAQRTTPTWAWSLAGLLIALGAVWILVEVWIRARLLIRRVRPLHRTLTKRFPEVVQDDQDHSTTVLRASDHVAQIMDALYLQSGGGVAFEEPGPPPELEADRAAAVARWAKDPMNAEQVGTSWIAPPQGISARRWVTVIARAYARAV